MAPLANFFFILALLSVNLFGADHVIGTGSGQWVVKSRMTVEFSKSTPVINLMRWPLIVDLIPDGSLVKEGDLLVRFDRESVENEIESKRYDLKINELQLNKSLKDIENKVKNIEDSLQEKRDQLSLLQARKDQWLSIPLKKDIDKAQGEVDVAQLNHSIAVREVEKAERRYEKGFVSKTELLKEREDFRRMEAEWEYAQQMLLLAKQPTTKSQMKKLDLEMKSVSLDIQQLEKELKEQAFISEIQKKSEKRRMKMVEDDLEDKEKELEGIELRAPNSGLVRYTTRFKRSLNEGKKPRKSSTIMEIPDLTSLILKGVVSEREGYHLNMGDEVHFTVPHLPDQLQKGTVTSLSNSPRDITEGSDDWTMMGKESGIKVFDVSVTPSVLVPGLKLGMTAKATLFGSDPLEGPCVPLSHVWVDRSDYYLAIKADNRAVYEKVDGYIWENFLFLNGDEWIGKTIALHGEKPVGETEQQEPSGRLTILGELSPSEVIDVFVPDYNVYYRDLKITWLLEEGSTVKKGEAIARCVSEKGDSRLRDTIADLERAKGALETTNKEMALKEQSRVIDLKKAQHDLEIAKITHEVNQSAINAQQYYASLKDLKVQEVNLESAQRARDDRLTKKTLYSQRQIKDVEMDLQVAKLNHRSAEIKFDQASRGMEPLDLKKSEIDLLRKDNALRQLEISQVRDRANDERTLIARRKNLSRVRKQVEDMTSDQGLFEITASQAGILKFVKVWDGTRMSKLSTNSNVREGMRIMSITGAEDMLVKLEVPERYSHLVTVGMSLELAIPGMGLSAIAGKVVSRNPIFETKKRPDTERIDLYSRQEELGYSVFELDIALEKSEVPYKIGSMVQVRFPFEAYP